MGLQHDISSIKGLEEAWYDPEHPVYLSKDHPDWKSTCHKYARFLYSYNSGNAFFCIPE